MEERMEAEGKAIVCLCARGQVHCKPVTDKTEERVLCLVHGPGKLFKTCSKKNSHSRSQDAQPLASAQGAQVDGAVGALGQGPRVKGLQEGGFMEWDGFFLV